MTATAQVTEQRAEALTPQQVKDAALAEVRRLKRRQMAAFQRAIDARREMHEAARAADRAGALRPEIAAAMGVSSKTAQGIVGPSAVPAEAEWSA